MTQLAPPAPHELEEDYTIRAHYALMQAIPDPMQRNRVVWDAWESARGNQGRAEAQQKFAAEQYDAKPDICLWHEHETETVGPDGKPMVRKNDVERLRAIVQENNHRIADTEAYTALIDKHTLRPGESDKVSARPKTLGFIGPFRLGMIGKVEPRFAIFGDEYHRKDKAEVLADRPRRSVEVLTLKANGRAYIDPVAAISEAPRLPLPVAQYSLEETDEGEVERFEAPAVPAMPGGGNTYLPGFGGKKKREHYSEPQPMPMDPPAQDINAPAAGGVTLKQILDALNAMPQFQWINEQMQQQAAQLPPGMEQAKDGDGDGVVNDGMPGQAPAPNPEPVPPQPQYGMQPMVSPTQGAYQGATRYESNEQPERYTAEQIDQIVERYDAMQTRVQELEQTNETLQERNAEMYDAISEMRQENAMMQRATVNAQREAILKELHAKAPQFVELEEELDRCLYSADSNMSDETFVERVAMIEKFAAKVPEMVTPMVPAGEAPTPRTASRPGRDLEKEAAIDAKSREIYAASGYTKSHTECWAEAESAIEQG